MTRALIIAALIALHGAPSGAQGVFCDDRATMIAALKFRLGQVRYGNRMPNSVGQTETYLNPISGTWTRIRNHMAGRACIIDRGQLTPEQPGEPT